MLQLKLMMISKMTNNNNFCHTHRGLIGGAIIIVICHFKFVQGSSKPCAGTTYVYEYGRVSLFLVIYNNCIL